MIKSANFMALPRPPTPSPRLESIPPPHRSRSRWRTWAGCSFCSVPTLEVCGILVGNISCPDRMALGFLHHRAPPAMWKPLHRSKQARLGWACLAVQAEPRAERALRSFDRVFSVRRTGEKIKFQFRHCGKAFKRDTFCKPSPSVYLLDCR